MVPRERLLVTRARKRKDGRTPDRDDGEGRLREARGGELRGRVTGGSPARTYRDLVAGVDSWSALLVFEILAVWGGRIPGAAGLAFRKILWPGLFLDADRSAVWGRGVELRHPGKMCVESGVVADDGCRLDAKGCARGEFVLGEGAMISRGCILSAKEGAIRLGPEATLGANSVLYSFGGIEIGADTMIAANCFLGGGRYDHRGRTDVPMHAQPLRGRGVEVGEDCWIGAGAVVGDGVSIGRGSVVGAGAVVLEDVPEMTVVGGVPARRLGTRPDGQAEGSSTRPQS